MRNKEDILIKDLLLEEMAKELLEQREFLRNDAKKNVETLQSENRKMYNKRRERNLRYTKERTINVNFVYYRIPKQRRLVSFQSAGLNDFFSRGLLTPAGSTRHVFRAFRVQRDFSPSVQA
ncbi:hypothetical protein TNCV_2556011 [Trichonephila clavipes]|nr:hypothetical protein TNCV_2556011 [Trichonephila clavipes]